jgi:hypothetical protein
MRTKLDGVTQHVELCDESGRTIGHFLPPSVYDELFYAALAAESPHSPQELRLSHQETGGRTLKEIWKSLGRTS